MINSWIGIYYINTSVLLGFLPLRKSIYYYHFVGHCGAFCGLKWRFWQAKMYFSPLNCSDFFFVIFFSFYFLNALQKDINSNRVYVLGHKYVLGPSQTHFSTRLAARAKMSLSRAQNIFMPAKINSIVIFSHVKLR